MKFWRLDSYTGAPTEDAPVVGAIIGLRDDAHPDDLDGASLATHFNPDTNDWVSARWVECDDPREVSR